MLLRKVILLWMTTFYISCSARAISIADADTQINISLISSSVYEGVIAEVFSVSSSVEKPSVSSSVEKLSLEDAKALVNKAAVYSWAAYNSGVDRERADLMSRKRFLDVLSEDKSKSLAIMTYEEREGRSPLVTIGFPGTESWADVASYPHKVKEYPVNGKPSPEIGLIQGAYSGFLVAI